MFKPSPANLSAIIKQKELGAFYSKGEDWHPYALKDGLLITGQNPASSTQVAGILLETLS